MIPQGTAAASSIRPPALRRHPTGLLPSLPWRPSDTGIGHGSAQSVEVISAAGLERLARTLARAGDDDLFVTRCSWCGSFDVDGWCEAPTAAARLARLALDRPPTITHGICPGCADAFEESLAPDPA
ncbi:MAG: hypothetical protein U0R50_11480 [Gaiellales bacterium]